MKSRPRHLLSLGVTILAPALFGQGVIQLDQFTVSAQKRIQSVSEVPVPITVYTGSFLEEAGIHDYKSLAPLVPGLFIQEQSPNNPGINLRGITTDSGDPRSETRISLFQDGVSISRSRASVVELFDLERVEVLKGPQGTLFGRGAEIGAISFIQRKARNENSGSLDVGFGDYNERRAAGVINTPLAKDVLFGRFAFSWTEHDGWLGNLADGSTLNGKKTLALRGSLRWQPTAQTSVDVIANWQHDTPPGTAFKSGVIPTSRGDTSPFLPAELNRGSALGLDRTVAGVTAIVDHEISKEWSVTATTGWREHDSYENFDADGSRIFLLEFAEDSRGRQFSQEFRVNFKGRSGFTGFFGASYFNESGATRVPFYTDERQLWPFLAGTFRDSLTGLGLPSALVGAAIPAANPFAPQSALPLTFAAFNNPLLPPQLRALSGLAGAPLQARQSNEYTQSGRTRATDLFMDGTWRVTDRLELTAGLRLTHDQIDSGYEASNATPPTLGFIVNSIPGYPYLPSGGRRNAGESSSSWDGRLVGRYALTKEVNAFAGIARGHRPRGILIDSTTTSNVREETVVNYELGVKGALAGGKVQWSATGYHYNYAHFQTTVLSLGKFSLEDAGNATGRGFELSVQGRVADGLSLFANYALTKATFDDTDSNGRRQQYGGFTFRMTPQASYAIGGTLTIPTGEGSLYVTPSWSYKGKHYFEDNNANFAYGLRQDGFGIANVRLGWRSAKGKWDFSVYVRNAFDQEYIIDAGNTGGSFGIPTYIAGEPLRWGVQGGMKW